MAHTRLLTIDNVGATNPHDFTVMLPGAIKNVTRIELVSASAEVRDMVATLHVSFGSLERTFEWPIMADRDYDSPLSIHAKNRYYAVFENPMMPRLDRVHVRVEGLIAGPIALKDEAIYETNARVCLVLSVTHDPDSDVSPPLVTMGNKADVLRDYYLVDSRDADRNETSLFRFRPSRDRAFHNVMKVSLKEAVVSRRITDEPYVLVSILGHVMPLFFEYATYGAYYPYELLKSTDYNTIEYDPPLSVVASPEVQLSSPNPNVPLYEQDGIVLLLFEVEYVPRVEINPSPNPPLKTQKAHILVDNLAYGGVFNFVHVPDRTYANVRSISLKHLTFPSPAWATEDRPYYVTMGIPGLGISWKIPYNVSHHPETLNTMVVLPRVHHTVFEAPVNFTNLTFAFKNPDGSDFALPADYSQPPRLAFVLEIIYDPRV